MTEKPETKFRKKTYKYLDALPCTWWCSIQMIAIRGIPDVIMCIRGHFTALEYKKDAKEKPGKLQQYIHHMIREAGGTVMVVCPENWDETHRLLKVLAQKRG